MVEAVYLLVIAADPVRLVPMFVAGWRWGHRGAKGWLFIVITSLLVAFVMGFLLRVIGSPGSAKFLSASWMAVASVAGVLDAAFAALVRWLLNRRNLT